MSALLSAAQRSFETAIANGRFKPGRFTFEKDGSVSFREAIAAGAVARGEWPAALCPAWLAHLLDVVFVAVPVCCAPPQSPSAESPARQAAMKVLRSMDDWGRLTPARWSSVRRAILAGLLDDIAGRSIAPATRADGWSVLKVLFTRLADFIRDDDGAPPSHTRPEVIANTLALEHEVELFKCALDTVDAVDPAAMKAFFRHYAAAVVSLSGTLDALADAPPAQAVRHEAALVAIAVITEAIAVAGGRSAIASAA